MFIMCPVLGALSEYNSQTNRLYHSSCVSQHKIVFHDVTETYLVVSYGKTTRVWMVHCSADQSGSEGVLSLRL